MSKIPIALSWSGGKDCSYALHLIQQEGKYEVKYLLSTCNAHTRELNMHHLHESLMAAQAAAIGIPLKVGYVNAAQNASYEAAFKTIVAALQQEGIYHIAFGDIFLADIRQYREQLLHPLGMHCIFPLWQKPTNLLIQEIITAGFKSIVCCIASLQMEQHWLGKTLDNTNIATLPKEIDACGENGEYHTFCYDGPVFRHPLSVLATEVSSQRMPLHANELTIFSWVHLHLVPQG